jgi:hypothetical protein
VIIFHFSQCNFEIIAGNRFCFKNFQTGRRRWVVKFLKPHPAIRVRWPAENMLHNEQYLLINFKLGKSKKT